MHPTLKSVLTVAAMLSCIGVYSQATLKDRLEGKQSVSEIMSEVDKYYHGQPPNWKGEEGSDPRLIHWKRWEWFWSGRIAPEGETLDINERLMKANASINDDVSRNLNSAWTLTGPNSTDSTGIGRADRIAFHPTEENTFYVGTPNGGLWKTVDGGQTWIPLTDFMTSIGISGIVVSWANPDVIYILTGDGDSDLFGGLVDLFNYERKSLGVYKSTDAGLTWKKTAPLTSNPYLGLKMVQDPTNANVLLVATTIGVFRTQDGGASWTLVQSGEFFDIQFKPGTTKAYVAGRDSINTSTAFPDVYYSNDGGLSWIQSTIDDSTLTNVTRIELAVTPANPNYVYLIAGNIDTFPRNFGGLFLSTNSGISYQMVVDTPNILGLKISDNDDQARYTSALVVSPLDADMIFSGAVKTFRSLDGGATWDRSVGMHDDIHELAYNPLNDYLYACHDGGVSVSTNNGITWTSLWTGFATSQIYHLAGTPLQTNHLFAGLQDNGCKLRTTDSQYFRKVRALDGFSTAFSPTDTNTLYYSSNTSIYRSLNDTIKNISPAVPDSMGNLDTINQWFGELLTHVTDENMVFVGYDKVYRSNDKGLTWTNTGASGKWSMAKCPSDPNRLYAAGAPNHSPNAEGKLWRTDNLGDQWDTLNVNPGFPTITDEIKITHITVHPSNSNIVVVTIGGFIDTLKVFLSIDAGESWEPLTGTLPNVPVNCAQMTSAGEVYIGTDIGVFYRSPAMIDWMPWRNGLPMAPVTDIVIHENEDKMYCSTFGRGVWQSELVDMFCPLFYTLVADQTGYHIFQAELLIQATCRVVGSANSNIHLKSNGYVAMLPGFVAEQDAVFSATVAPCGSPGLPLYENDGNSSEKK